MLYALTIFYLQCTRQNSINSKTRCLIKYSTMLKKKFDFNWREHLSVGTEKKRERKRKKTQVECLSIGETTRAFFRVETFDSVSEDAKNLYLSVFLFFLSLSILANCRHLRPHLPSRSVLRRGGKYLSWLPPTPRLVFSSFFRQARSAHKWGATAEGGGGWDLIGRFS